ncbi:MAG TPA: Ig-like domain-containing protein [Myxococcota bacterium]|nr:Ig-like domain-containing protein [Myxococcota bacterium]HRY97042.1 Ig-like domain-containing protein [Myxococcota bacterium]HSA24299.1 Ig-like domain-containing protein [Myxococcota bacterium]
MARAVWVALGLLVGACQPPAPPGGDVLPPWVVEFAPQGEAVPLETEVVVTFSEPVAPEAAVTGLVVLVEESALDEGFHEDLDEPPLTKKRKAALVPVEARLAGDGELVRLTPAGPLLAGAAYWVLVSSAVTDQASNPLVAELVLDENGRVVSPRGHASHRFQVRAGGGEQTDGGPDGGPDGGAWTEAGPADGPAPAALRLAWSEVLANPAGDEAAGEYLELASLETGPVELAGLRLDDQGGAEEGEELATCAAGAPASLPPGGVALVVGRAFAPPAELPAGTLLLCTPRDSLTPRGLRNSGGEILVLRDALGRELTRFGGWLDFSAHEGCGARRAPLAGPDGEEAWSFPGGPPCATPGWLDEAQTSGAEPP